VAWDSAVVTDWTNDLAIRQWGRGVWQRRNVAVVASMVVASMVLPAIPDWAPAMRARVEALAPDGLFVFTVNHPCFEQLWPSWRSDGEYRTRRYLAEYEMVGPSGVDFHRTLSTYHNELIHLGCRLTEIVEPCLSPEAAATGPQGIDAYVYLPNFLVVAARPAVA
jgi:hypothetical protein